MQYALSPIIQHDLTCRQKIELVVQTFVDVQKDDAFAVCPFGRLVMEVGNSEPTLHKLINQILNRFHTEMSRLIQQGINSREFRQETDAAVLSNVLLVAIQGGIVLSRAQGDARAMTETCRYILDGA